MDLEGVQSFLRGIQGLLAAGSRFASGFPMGAWGVQPPAAAGCPFVPSVVAVSSEAPVPGDSLVGVRSVWVRGLAARFGWWIPPEVKSTSVSRAYLAGGVGGDIFPTPVKEIQFGLCAP